MNSVVKQALSRGDVRKALGELRRRPDAGVETLCRIVRDVVTEAVEPVTVISGVHEYGVVLTADGALELLCFVMNQPRGLVFGLLSRVAEAAIRLVPMTSPLQGGPVVLASAVSEAGGLDVRFPAGLWTEIREQHGLPHQAPDGQLCHLGAFCERVLQDEQSSDRRLTRLIGALRANSSDRMGLYRTYRELESSVFHLNQAKYFLRNFENGR